MALEKIAFNHERQILLVGSIISYLIGNFELLFAFLVIWVSYFIVESRAEDFGIDVFGIELITLAAVWVGMHFSPTFTFIYVYLVVALISGIDSFVDPEKDEISNPFGDYSLGYGIAGLSASYLSSGLSIAFLLIISAVVANVSRILFSFFVYREVEITLTPVSNVFFNGVLGLVIGLILS